MSAQKKSRRSRVRALERTLRIERLIAAGIIRSADEIPVSAIPARVDYVQACRATASLLDRPPYYVDSPFRCTDCQRASVWTAEEQRHWYELVDGTPFGVAARCRRCRRRRRHPGQKR